MTEIRGKLIEDLTREDLIALHTQIHDELPQEDLDLAPHHAVQLMELEAIEDELEKR